MAPDAPERPMLTVKHRVPPVRAGAVVRDRLVRQLELAEERLTLVAAPAGWGKTSLLSAWARSTSKRIAWVSLDEGDDEPVRFWRYVLTALTESSEEISAAALESVSLEVPVVDLAIPVLLNELAEAQQSHVLVLDDYHLLSDARIHEAVELLVTYLPASLRVVVAGRADPPLPLARMRARGELSEIRAAQLGFTSEEAVELLTSVAGHELDVDADDSVLRRTEGWAAGLQLAALALRSGPGTHQDDRHVMEYFAAEVLPGLDPRQRDLLVRSAPLERLSGPLCDVALEVTGSDGVLRDLVRADLFVAPLDEEHHWFRCHDLLRDALLRQPEADPGAVLTRAAAWYAEQDRVDEAVGHLLRAGRHPAAAELLVTRADDWFLARGEAATLVGLAERLPETEIGPSLAYAAAFAAALCGDRDRVRRWLDACDRVATPDATAPGWHSFEAAVLTMRANFALPDTESAEAVTLTRRAVDLESAGAGPGHPAAPWGLGASLARDGHFAESADVLSALWSSRRGDGWPPSLVLSVAGTLVISLVEAGRGEDCDRVLRQLAPQVAAAERRDGRGITPGVSALRLAEGRRRHDHGDPAGAVEVLRHAVSLVELHPRPTLLVVALVHLAEAELGAGDRTAARTALGRAREVVDDEPVSAFAISKLEAVANRMGRGAVRTARRSGSLVEELTDRELSILRALQGSATQREIGAALNLSMNTVKAYTKSLYRKLLVGSRAEAVTIARELGLI